MRPQLICELGVREMWERKEDLKDDDLMKLVSEGQMHAFEVLFERYGSKLLGYARSMLKSIESGEDVTQDVWLKVARLTPKYKREGKFSAWIYRMTRNGCLNYLRDNNRLVFSAEELESNIESGVREMDEELITKSDFKHVQDLINDLPDSQRLALLLSSVEELTYEEVGAELNLTVSAVKSLIFRARKNLLDKLEDQN